MERLSCKHWMQAELLHFMHMLMSDMLQCMTFEVTDDICACIIFLIHSRNNLSLRVSYCYL